LETGEDDEGEKKKKIKKKTYFLEKNHKKNKEQSRVSIDLFDLFRFLEGVVGNNSRMHIAHAFVICTYSKYYVFKMRENSPKV
jgi:hypothetical protein